MGVPADYVSIFSGTATPEEIDLLRSGVKYEALKPLKEYEENGEDTEVIKEFLKKGISFKTAKSLEERMNISGISQELIIANIYPSLDEYKIIKLAKLDEERGTDWITGKDKELLYKNMVEAKAEWLYTLDAWNTLIPDENRRNGSKGNRFVKHF